MSCPRPTALRATSPGSARICQPAAAGRHRDFGPGLQVQIRIAQPRPRADRRRAGRGRTFAGRASGPPCSPADCPAAAIPWLPARPWQGATSFVRRRAARFPYDQHGTVLLSSNRLDAESLGRDPGPTGPRRHNRASAGSPRTMRLRRALSANCVETGSDAVREVTSTWQSTIRPLPTQPSKSGESVRSKPDSKMGTNGA